LALVVLSVVEQRLDAVRAVLAGAEVGEVAARAGVHRSTVHRWLVRYLAEQIGGLADRSHRPSDAHNNSLEDIAYYLEAALEEAGDDPVFITQAIGVIARSQNFSELARKVDMSREGLYKALSNNGNPSFATIYKVARALGLKLEFHAVA